MSMFRRVDRQVPSLNTASLPDLIFTVLFFFMIVTHMRTETVRVRFRQPQGTELTRLVKKSVATHIYIGTPQGAASGTVIQMNDKYVRVDEIERYMRLVVSHLSPEEREQMTVSLKADRATKMGIITEVKLALRRAGALKISYSADEEKVAH
ncbi:biopolymer transporter ExbD [Prevotella sp. oral taxon 376]|uniref:ExbD/TolR family protein n=1 Tax=Prevotella sp. oral taxon 376 TaxID=712466 RepID=UPI000D1F6F59|nr:biopolymer transporter ExbD [Prevotella sp. oral taxon 376]PTL32988.1 biopolymer transporter ExbD [Prevotella sp. oral taxon 376]